MRWHTEHVIPAPLDLVERILFDPATAESIPKYIKGIARSSVVKLDTTGPTYERIVHYVPSMAVLWWVRRVKPEQTEWNEVLRWNPREHAGTFEILPNMPEEMRSYFNAAGTYLLEAREPNRTVRRIDADLTIKFGMMAGSMAERIIIGIIKRQYRHEATLLARRAAEAGASAHAV